MEFPCVERANVIFAPCASKIVGLSFPRMIRRDSDSVSGDVFDVGVYKESRCDVVLWEKQGDINLTVVSGSVVSRVGIQDVVFFE